jgi:hypothetical protein
MRSVDLTTWAEFKREITQLRADCDEKRVALGGPYVSVPSFRGHASKEWPLATTLERAGYPKMTMAQYGYHMARIAPEIATQTNRAFKVPNRQETDDWLAEVVRNSYFPPGAPPGYEFMVYLRHHGFPSPLLDWTDSEFVAAYFAFADPPPGSHVAIYAFMEYADGFKVGSPLSPTVIGVGPYVIAHPRHFTQQARYTLCRKYDDDHQWKYVPHEWAFMGAPLSETDRQDVLVRYVLPADQRKVVLDDLFRMNITPYSLFQTEDSLMKTMALKVL